MAFGRIILILILFIVANNSAIASPSEEIPTMSAIGEASERSEDTSRRMLVSMFGNVVNDPLSGTSGSDERTLATAVFLVFNGALFTVAAALVIYYFVRWQVTGAAQGTFGAASSKWGVLRTVIMASSLFPLGNGWNLAQLLMLWATSFFGVGTANLAVDTAVSYFNAGSSMIVEPASPDTTDLSKKVFLTNICAIGTNKDYERQAALGISIDPDWSQQNYNLTDGDGNTNGFIIKSGTLRKRCGGAEIDSSLGDTSWVESRILGLDNSATYEAHRTALMAMQTSSLAKAEEFIDDVIASQTSDTRITDPTIVINEAARAYETVINASITDRTGDLDDLVNALTDRISERGWYEIGAWYQTFAQANSKIANAVSTTAATLDETHIHERTQIHKDGLAAYAAMVSDTTTASPLSHDSQLSPSNGDTEFRQIFGAPMQALTTKIATMDHSTFDGENANPVIKMKNLGDTILSTASTIIIVQTGMNAIGEGLSSIPVVGSALNGAKDVLNTYTYTIVVALVVVGIGLAVYLPFVPFIIWFMAVINWMIIVVEAVISASLWAFAHVIGAGTEEEGMGQRASYGYIFLLNIMLRPALMVAAFFAAGAIVNIGGVLFNNSFSTVVANVQYDAWTGAFSLIGFLFVYYIVMQQLVFNCFGLINIIPDQVIGIIGGQPTTTLGRDSANQGSSKFFGMVGRGERTSNSLSRLKPPKPNNSSNNGIQKG